MAWLWKQGRPTLLTMVGMGVLGYKALHRGYAPVQQRQAEVGLWGVPTAPREGGSLSGEGKSMTKFGIVN